MDMDAPGTDGSYREPYPAEKESEAPKPGSNVELPADAPSPAPPPPAGEEAKPKEEPAPKPAAPPAAPPATASGEKVVRQYRV